VLVVAAGVLLLLLPVLLLLSLPQPTANSAVSIRAAANGPSFRNMNFPQ
jgi:hypothetical protein